MQLSGGIGVAADRLEGTSGWLIAGMAIIVLAIVVATPQYAEPALAGDDPPAEAMIQPADLAELVATILALPNTASLAELLVNCRLEDTV